MTAFRPRARPVGALPPLRDTDPMPCGAHQGTPMQDVSARYLHWIYTNITSTPPHWSRVVAYIEENLSALKLEHRDGIWER